LTTGIILLFMASIACDVGGQLALKLGSRSLPDASADGVLVYVARLFAERWLLLGIAIYAVEFVVWVRILSLTPLNVAFPLASLNILGIVLAGRVFLGESVSSRQWSGAALITLGVAIVSQSV
jgi:multidrug transporter EmrE-like cation transporter